jgi:hypothetical protein
MFIKLLAKRLVYFNRRSCTTIFDKIISKEIASNVLYEDEFVREINIGFGF